MLVAQSYPTLWDPVDCSQPGASVHEIPQARILEWVAYPFSRGSSQPRDWTSVSCIAGIFFTVRGTRGALLREELALGLCRRTWSSAGNEGSGTCSQSSLNCLPASSWCLGSSDMFAWGLRCPLVLWTPWVVISSAFAAGTLVVLDHRTVLRCPVWLPVSPVTQLVPRLLSHSSLCVFPPLECYFQTIWWPDQLLFSGTWQRTHSLQRSTPQPCASLPAYTPPPTSLITGDPTQSGPIPLCPWDLEGRDRDRDLLTDHTSSRPSLTLSCRSSFSGSMRSSSSSSSLLCLISSLSRWSSFLCN